MRSRTGFQGTGGCIFFLIPYIQVSLVVAYLFHGLVKGGGSAGVKQVPLVGVHGNLILAKHTMMSQLGHPLTEQLLRIHLQISPA